MNQGHHPPLTVEERAEPSLKVTAADDELAYQIAKRIRERIRRDPIDIITANGVVTIRDIRLAD